MPTTTEGGDKTGTGRRPGAPHLLELYPLKSWGFAFGWRCFLTVFCSVDFEKGVLRCCQTPLWRMKWRLKIFGFWLICPFFQEGKLTRPSSHADWTFFYFFSVVYFYTEVALEWWGKWEV